jgi:hypothetical protein
MESKEIIDYCEKNLPEVSIVESGEKQAFSIILKINSKEGYISLPSKKKDGDNDKASNLDRSDIYRLNIGVGRNTFLKHFAEIPARPSKGGVIDMDCDFTQKGVLMPHPVYGWMSWVCILNPTIEYFNSSLKELIDEAYELARQKAKKRK